MSVIIDVQEATINTVSVEIRTLTISRKQVTLAVFRQLPMLDIIEDYGIEVGLREGAVPWGTVNYHWDVCDREEEGWHNGRYKPYKYRMTEGSHLHVVWQDVDELRHALVLNPRLWIKDWWDYENAPDKRLKPDLHAVWEADRERAWQTYKAAYQPLTELPQLFIAV